MKYEPKSKEQNIKTLNNLMLTKTLSMFEYENLPETLPQKELEKLLQSNGFAFITKVEGEIYAFNGGLGGVQDAYYNQSQITISNPFLNFNETLDLEKDGVLFCNDSLKLGLLDYYEKQNTLLVENDLNMFMWGINSRVQQLITAPDDKSKDSAEQFLKKVVDGDLGVIGENALFDGVKVHNKNSGGSVSVKDMLEYHQYLKSNLYNEVGLSSNFNMKRERLLSAEIDQNEDSLFPLVYNMMQCRIEAVKKINAMFNLNIKVDFGSVWHYKNKKLIDGLVENDDEKRELDNVSVQGGEIDSSISATEQEQNPETIEQDQEQEREREQDQAPEPEPEPETETTVNDDEPVEEVEEVETVEVEPVEEKGDKEND